jgi:hypothetical protein
MTAQLRRAPHLPETIVDWPRRASCQGHGELYFADDKFSQQLAVRICQDCPVRTQCLAECLANEKRGQRYGVVAGFTAVERKAWSNR